MAKALKTAAVIAALALVISSFGACSFPFGDDTPTTNVPAVTTTEKTTDSELTSNKPTSQTTTAAPENQEKLDDIFTDIKNFEIGTAGSSAKAANLALRLIAFSSSDLAKAENFEYEVKTLVDTIDSAKADDYTETLYQINLYAKKFFSGNEETVINTADISNFDTDKEYSQDSYDELYYLLSK